MKFEWDKKNIEVLEAQWKAGTTATIIAKKLGTTRSSVIGKAHRMKLPSRSTISGFPVNKPGPKTKQVRVWNPKGQSTPPKPVKNSNTLKPTAKSLIDLGRNDCRFPIGEPNTPGYGYCGRERDATSAYCQVHHQITSSPTSQARYD